MGYDIIGFGYNLYICIVYIQFHVLTKGMVHAGMWMLKLMPVEAVDIIISIVARFSFGDLSEIGIPTPKIGPFQLKTLSRKTPVIDTGSIHKIRNKKITVRIYLISNYTLKNSSSIRITMNYMHIIIYTYVYKYIHRFYLE